MFEELKKNGLTETSVQNVLDIFPKDSLTEIKVLPAVFFNFFQPEKAYIGRELEEGVATGKVGWFIEGKTLDGDSMAILYMVGWQHFTQDILCPKVGIALENLEDFFEKECEAVRMLVVDDRDDEDRHTWLVRLRFTKELFKEKFHQDVLDYFPGYKKVNEDEKLELVFLKAKELSRPELQRQVDAMVKSVYEPRRDLHEQGDTAKSAHGFWAKLKKFFR